jgi:glutamate synthase (NADPH/NADH) small chain
MTKGQQFVLPAERPESPLKDKKPLMSAVEARAEAERCLYCSDAPCIKACPTTIDIPTFIKKIASGNVRGSARTILKQNALGYSCARVCPVEVLCEGSCVYEAWQHEPISIGRLQRYATEHARTGAPLFEVKPATKRKVACVGAGPASLACAAYLAMEGHEVVIFEKRAVPGGLNTTGIAPYKLKADDALREIAWVLSLGRVKIETGKEIGKDVSTSELLSQYDAVFIGVGLGEDTKLGVPGEDGEGVVGATAWIEKLKTNAGKVAKLGRVLVVGGGNTAIDVAREAALLGAEEVTMVYRRTLADMSGYDHELEGARKDGVRVMTNLVPTEVVRGPKKELKALRVARAEGGKPVAGTEHELACDLIALAIGQSKLRSIAQQFPGVALDPKGCVVANAETCVTGNPKVYAGGDCINGGKEVVNAAADGRNAARAMMAAWKDGN